MTPGGTLWTIFSTRSPQGTCIRLTCDATFKRKDLTHTEPYLKPQCGVWVYALFTP